MNAGDTLGDYRLLERIGQGAMGQVWLGEDTILARRVAVKLMTSLSSAESRLRFLVEARAIARLRHPNVLAVHHAALAEPAPYLVTELLSGRSLDRLPMPLPYEQALDIAIELARGLAAAHRAGVLHRDIKPANAFLCEDGSAKLIDFGLAKLVPWTAEPAPATGSQERARKAPTVGLALGATLVGEPATGADGVVGMSSVLHTRPGAIVGTPLYLAPELWAGSPASRRSDVYALGAVLYELLSGRPPITATSLAELQARVLTGRGCDPLGESAPHLPAPLVETVERCLARAAMDRPPSADALRELLEAIRGTASGGVGVAVGSAGAEDLPVAQPPTAEDTDENPYRGLDRFEARHRALFFGRSSEVRTVLQHLRSSSMVVIAGPSGAGKSSLVLAGVLPEVEVGALGRRPWRVARMVPGKHPVRGLATALAPLVAIDPELLTVKVQEDPGALAQMLRARGVSEGILLFIDQLEEVCTLSTADERGELGALLSQLVELGAAVRVIATLRSDFLGRLDELGALRAEILRAVVVLGPLQPEALRDAIREPAARRGYCFEPPELVDRFLVRAGQGALPLVQFALARLWEHRDRERRVLTSAAVDAMGGVSGALSAHAEQVFLGLGERVRGAARYVLCGLVTTARTRARREEHELVRPGDRAEADRRALAALVAGRLVVAEEGERGAAYEVAHEVLLSGWQRLAGWLEEDGASRVVAERLALAAAEWERAGRPADGLWSARQLSEARLLTQEGLGPPGLAFLEASRLAERRERHRRWSLRVGVPAALLGVLMGVLAILRWRETGRAEAVVERHLQEARAVERDAERAAEANRGARTEALAGYDAGDLPAGERLWQRVAELDERETHLLSRASAEIDRALARVPAHPVAVRRAAELAFRWILVAERMHDRALALELRERLRRADAAWRRAHVEAPARLVVESDPRARLELREAGGPTRALRPGERIELPAGSYLVEAAWADARPARLPLLLERGADHRVSLAVVDQGTFSDRVAFVPAGSTRFGAAEPEAVRRTLGIEPDHAVLVPAFLIARRRVSLSDYLEYLHTLPTPERADRCRRVATPVDLASRSGTEIVLPLGASGAAQAPVCPGMSVLSGCADCLSSPVVGPSYADALAYLAWLSRSGALAGARPCGSREWSRAAWGADARVTAGQVRQGASEAMPSSPFGLEDLDPRRGEWVSRVGHRGEPAIVRYGYRELGADAAGDALRFSRADLRTEPTGFRACAPAPTLERTP